MPNNDLDFSSLPELATEKQLADFLSKSTLTLWRERKRGRLSFHRIGNEIRYTHRDVQEYLDRGRVAAMAA